MFEREEKCCIHRIRVKGEHSASNTEPLEIQMMRAKRKAQQKDWEIKVRK